MNEISPQSRGFLDRYGAARGEFAGAEIPWLARLRELGADAFADIGLPTRRLEEWKYTSLQSLEQVEFAAFDGVPDTAARVPPVANAASGARHRLVLVNGRLDAGLSDLGRLPAGATIGGLAPRIGDFEAHLGRLAGPERL